MPRNLIVVVFDTLRYDAVFGSLANTPHLDRFAQQSAVFDNAWSEGLPTIPFRRALYTGMRTYPWRHRGPERGVFPHEQGWQAIPDDQTTIAEYLYAQGYATQLISDLWHMFKPTMNFTRGFVSTDVVRGQEGDTYRFGAPSLGDARHLDPARVGPAAYLHQIREERHSEDDYFAAQVFDRATRFVKDIQHQAPYCLWVESFSPHEFWDPPLRFADAYHPATTANYIVPSALNNRDPSTDDIARTRALYQGYVTFCDERFGRFLDGLERFGSLDDSIIAVLSDHGTELWDKQRFGKSSARLHAYNTHINLMIRHPDGHGAGQHVAAFVQNHDIAPTLLRLLGVETPPMDGTDIWPLTTPTAAADVGETARDHVIIGWGKYVSVRDHTWNLLLNTLDPADPARLFNVADDPVENIDVAGHHPDVVRALKIRLENLLGGPLPARYQHQPGAGPEATPGGLRAIRTQQRRIGESWSESNLI